ncbi:antibiotic biosynthesis monooxygenase [Desmonostoc muscorum LEGE 12446]|uniref:antibiotic biosynthesis monooxygenase family protein n=1 Tax=Desmonostoc muscorum TaxID=1179 RepID=UPI001F1D67E6|nr:antibiotic biosynthesis monooxygenase [Desmonostoc muscorum]MCF2151870.1 antibiotic biosynthesis monooxygenase [Desmonostoc muscorum LEGE 12446]
MDSFTLSFKIHSKFWLLTSEFCFDKYLTEAGIKKIQSIPGNLGAQVFRRTNGTITEFTVISYWESRNAIRAFAGNDIEQVHPLPKDNPHFSQA